MKTITVITAEPGYRAWELWGEEKRSYANYLGDVIAWVIEIEPNGDKPPYIYRYPVTLREAANVEGIMVERHGRIYQPAGLDSGNEYENFESWLRQRGGRVLREYSRLAQQWYGLGEDWIEGDEDGIS